MPRTATKKAVSTVGVDKAVMDRVRETAKVNRLSVFDLTNQLLTYALDQGKIEIQVQNLTIQPVKKK